MASKIQLRRGLSTQWAASNPTLAAGEIGIETDTQQLKIGNGSTAWNSLPYIATGNMNVAGSNLDDLADGTTYKRVLAAIATALNASTIVAGTQWGSGNDGNGGQPPAPKIRAPTSSNLIGEMCEATCLSDADLVAPNPSGGSTWAVIRIYAIDDFGVGWKYVYDYPTSFNNQQVVAGGTTFVIASAHPGKAMRAIMIRQA